jgi:hypothetical protein
MSEIPKTHSEIAAEYHQPDASENIAYNGSAISPVTIQRPLGRKPTEESVGSKTTRALAGSVVAVLALGTGGGIAYATEKPHIEQGFADQYTDDGCLAGIPDSNIEAQGILAPGETTVAVDNPRHPGQTATWTVTEHIEQFGEDSQLVFTPVNDRATAALLQEQGCATPEEWQQAQRDQAGQ